MSQMIEQKPLAEFTEKAYLNYSMYVILDRALPHLADGLKPVQRRIIYAMSELGLKASAKYKKSARTVGDVLGKFHPHGDSACYEAMVLMAQPFSYRYPFVDGQGNWGSSDDPKSFAAMRYTEARLSNYADLLLGELQHGTVEWEPNFDGTLLEPELLPARLPNVLLNGATGIAVGMAADILPHNLVEVANACIHLLDNPKATLDDIRQFILAPDFPTNAEIITPQAQINSLYATGLGSIKMRAIYNLENKQIVITGLPYQVSGSKIIEQIALQMQQKKLPMIEDLRDESDHEHPTRLVLIPRGAKFDVENLMSHLFATTDLERSYRINFNLIGLDGKPQVKNLLTLLNEWLIFRIRTVTKRLEYRLNKVLERLHILQGLLIAFLNIDEVIRIIREEDQPKIELINQFKLSEKQAEAILELKLRHLARLEEMKLQRDHDELSREQQALESLLNSPARLKKQIKKEIIADRDLYGDARRSPVIEREIAAALKHEYVIPNEPITVVLSAHGWVRAAKGHEINGQDLSYKAQDEFKTQTFARSNHPIIFFDTEGKVYSLPGHVLPSARGQGEPLSSKLNPNEGQHFTQLASGAEQDWLLLASDAGYGFLTQIKDLHVKNRNGKACVKLPPHSNLLKPTPVKDIETQQVVCATNTGRLLIFPLKEVPVLTKGKGNKLIGIATAKSSSREEYMTALTLMHPSSALTVHAGKRHFTLKPADLAHYSAERGKRGNRLPRGLQQVTAIEVVEAI